MQEFITFRNDSLFADQTLRGGDGYYNHFQFTLACNLIVSDFEIFIDMFSVLCIVIVFFVPIQRIMYTCIRAISKTRSF